MTYQHVEGGQELERLRLNIFPESWAGIEPAAGFARHRHCAAPHSSQALAVDVFGWIRQLEPAVRDAAVNAIAQRLGLEPDSGWQVELEWQDPDNLLNEKQHGEPGRAGGVTTVDVLARSKRYLLCIECKFTEGPGCCSQLSESGGPRQCSGEYRLQTNPRSGVEARCALSGKGIRYWEQIPGLFGFAAQADHVPCPFAGEWYQLMRNCALAVELGRREGRWPVFALLYARGADQGFAAAQFVADPGTAGWGAFCGLIRREVLSAGAVDWEGLLAELCDSLPAVTRQTAKLLRHWVLLKIRCAQQREKLLKNHAAQ